MFAHGLEQCEAIHFRVEEMRANHVHPLLGCLPAFQCSVGRDFSSEESRKHEAIPGGVFPLHFHYFFISPSLQRRRPNLSLLHSNDLTTFIFTMTRILQTFFCSFLMPLWHFSESTTLEIGSLSSPASRFLGGLAMPRDRRVFSHSAINPQSGPF